MRTIFLKCISLFFVTGLLSSCNAGGKKVVENNIQFDSLYVEKTYHWMDIETNPGCSLQIEFIYPVDFAGKEILAKVQQLFIRSNFGDGYANLPAQEAINSYAEDRMKEFKSEEKQYSSDMENHSLEPDEIWYAGDEVSKNQIVYNQNDLLSFVVYRECMKGGDAHSAHNYTNGVIDLKTGLRVMENEIFMDDYKDDLAQIIVESIALLYNVDNASDLEDIGFFNINEIVPNKNFYVDETGITYTFNEYEIAAYVVGAISVQIPYEKIKHLLRKESPVASIVF